MKRPHRKPPRWFVPAILLGGVTAGAIVAGLIASTQ